MNPHLQARQLTCPGCSTSIVSFSNFRRSANAYSSEAVFQPPKQHSAETTRNFTTSLTKPKRRRLHSACCSLPPPLPPASVSTLDVEFLKNEIEYNNQYLQHGVGLQAGYTVIDVGANIGIFSMAAARLVAPNGRVIACEPLLPSYTALQSNVTTFHNTQQRPINNSIKALHCGVGDSTQNTANFTLYPRAAGWGTLSSLEDESTIIADMVVFLENAVTARSSFLPLPLQLLGRLLLFISKPLFKFVARFIVKYHLLAKKQRFECRVVTVSDIIKEESLTSVDLLKIDTERAELAVLQGVDKNDWKRIQQVAAEVHEENLQGFVALLKDVAGFKEVVVSQTGELKGTSIYMVHCSRR